MIPDFGRRTLGKVGSAPQLSIKPATRPAPTRTPVDPELTTWTKQRAAARWRTWGICLLITLGGPVSFLMPDGLGQMAGMGLLGLGLIGFVARLRKSRKYEL